jgi:hypothetical protein
MFKKSLKAYKSMNFTVSMTDERNGSNLFAIFEEAQAESTEKT